MLQMLAVKPHQTRLFYKFSRPPLPRSYSLSLPVHERSCLLPLSLWRSSIRKNPFRALSSSSSGWDALLPSDPLDRSRSFPPSWLHDKRLAFTFFLGLITAFAISRVRISAAVVLPASALIFAAGFGFGFFRGGGFAANPVERNSGKDESGDKIKALLGNLDAVDANVDAMRSNLQNAIESRGVAMSELEDYLKIVETMKQLVTESKEAIGTTVANEEQKSNPAQFVGSFFRGNLGKEGKQKDAPGEQSKVEVLSDDEPNPRTDKFSGDFVFVDDLGSRRATIEEETESADEVFDRCITEANKLIKQAKMHMNEEHGGDRAEASLYKASSLLATATSIKPRSLPAVGLLGNAYLLHGELKLRITRELRSVINRKHLSSKDKPVTFLAKACEECEELLIEAGRKYKLALSIDENDARALYNWGLALSFRAQLVADVGPGSAFDADELYMAAIDKFDAMMAKSNAYTPDALFRWGLALQERARLRGGDSRERVKLLEQAMRLYEDAIAMDGGDSPAREALVSCVTELNYR